MSDGVVTRVEGVLLLSAYGASVAYLMTEGRSGVALAGGQHSGFHHLQLARRLLFLVLFALFVWSHARTARSAVHVTLD